MHCCTIRRSYRCDQCQLSRCCQRGKGLSGFDTIYGSVNGILGILNNNVINLSEIVANEETLNRLKHTPSMYLGSCRYKLPTVEESPETYAQIFEMFESLNIGAFFYIGGNDSMDTALKLSQYAASIGSDVRVIGVPKTIDNDLCLTDIHLVLAPLQIHCIYDLRDCT